MPDPIQVFDGDGVSRYTGLKDIDSWRMWIGVVNQDGTWNETEELGYIDKPEIRPGEAMVACIPTPPDQYCDCEDLYLTTHDEEGRYHWDLIAGRWVCQLMGNTSDKRPVPPPPKPQIL